MPKRPGSGSSEIDKLIERQMRNWELSRAQRPEPEHPAHALQVEDFVTISREVGAGGELLASGLGQRLGWPVFDKEILHAMAGDDRVRARLYELMDERDQGWIEETLRWLIEDEFRRDDYFHRLGETVLALARHGRAVFLGRGADLMLPRERGLRVGLIAPTEDRARRYAERHQMALPAARAEAQRIQQERKDFLRRHFGRRASEPTRHDMVFNMARVTIPEVIDVICQVLRNRGVIP
jgi:cytidylate kinase